MQKQRGCFITLEGVDGAGKSTHVQWVVQQLRAHGLSVVSTREPGGTALGEAVRNMVLTQPMALKTETLLMFAARCEHIHTVINPAIDQGQWVVCDRFTDASYAYQGGGRGLGYDAIHTLETWVHPGLQPDCTWLFDVPLAVARQRLAKSREPDRFEREGAAFFERTRQAYHEQAARNPARMHIIDSSQGIDAIRAELSRQITALVHQFGAGSSAAGLLSGPFES